MTNPFALQLSILIFFFCTIPSIVSNSQINWGSTQNISSNIYSNKHPRVVTNGSGEAVVIWTKGSDKSLYTARWNGFGFTTPVKINGSLMVAGASWMGPDIAAKGDTIYVVMKESPESDSGSHIYIVRSFDGGVTFSSPVQADNIQDSLSRFPTITTDDNGQPILAFMKFNASFGESRWVVSRSVDYGNSFLTDVKASGWGGSSEVCDCCPGAIVSKGSEVVLLYRDNNNNLRDTWMSVSHNGGQSFTSGCNIDNNNWNIMMCPSTGPDGIILNDSVYSGFCSGGSGVNRNYVSASSISASTTGAIRNLSTGIAGLSQQNYPRISSYGNAAAIVWQQTVNGIQQLPILFTGNLNQGFPSVWDTVDLYDITNTDVALADGKVFVVWEDNNSGTVKFRYGTYDNSTGVTQEELSSDISVYPNPTENELTIGSSVGLEGAVIMIQSHYGEVVRTITLDQRKQIRISVADLKAGIYFVQIAHSKYRLTRKIVKW